MSGVEGSGIEGAGVEGLSVQGTSVQGGSASVPESRIAATMGPFATGSTNLSSAFANDFGAGVTIITCIEVTARTGNQSISGTAGTTGGWQEQFSNTAHSLFFTGGTTMAYAEGAPAIGLNIIANTHLAAGPVRGCRNGAAAVQRNAAPTYVAVTGTPSTALGRHAGATPSACTATKILWQARLARDATDAELQSWTDNVNNLDRYRPMQTLVDAIVAQNLVSGSSWCWDAQTDYDSSASTSVTGIGTGPTWTKNGTPAKVTINPEVEKLINLSDWHFNVQDIAIAAASGGPTYHRGNAYREYRFTSNASRYTVKCIFDFAISILSTIGIRQDNTPLAPLIPDRFSVFRRLDVLGISGSHTYRVVDGMQSIVGSVASTKFDGTLVKASTSVLVQIDKTATFSVVAPAAATNTLLVLGDSFEGQNSTLTPTTEASLMKIRDEYPGNVIAFSFGSGSHFHIAADTATINSFVAAMNLTFTGTTSKRILDNFSANDHNLFSTFWLSRSAMRTQMGALFDAINAADANVTVHLRTGLLRTAAYEGSTVSDIVGPGTGAGTSVGGAIFQNIRDDYGTVQSSRTGFVFLHDGKAIFPNFAPSSNHNSGDNFHPTPAGQITIKDAEKIYLAAASDSVGTGY